MIDFAFINTGYRDFTPVIAGTEKCAPSHKFGPAVREYYLIHFCISGKGVLNDKNGTHHIGAGELFLIRPDEVTTYLADENNPWEYAWLGFVGDRCEQYSTARSVYKTPDGLDERLYRLLTDGVTSPEMYISIISELTYHLFGSEGEDESPTDRLRRIRRYVDYNYMQPLSVNGLARTFGFDRSYLFRIFKERYGMGLKEYITKVRMTRAVRLLDDGYPVCEVAAMVGYDDPFNFSKAFKSYFGVSPSKYGK